MTTSNQDELEKFSSYQSWWDIKKEARGLLQMNPVRLEWISRFVDFRKALVLDVGCGGGILSESIAQKGANVTGIDAQESCIKAAEYHARFSGVNISYKLGTIDSLITSNKNSFDVVTCMELLEHVKSPESIILAISELCKPNGHVFISTINRTAASFIKGILLAENVFHLLPQGTHYWKNFITIKEIKKYCKNANLKILNIEGISYAPIGNRFFISKDTDVSYIIHAQKL